MSKNSIRKHIIGCFGVLLTISLVSYPLCSPTPIQKQIAPGITLHILQGDITKLNNVDVIVNAANKKLMRGGGVCGSIFAAAEQNNNFLSKYIENQFPNGINPGQAVITPSFLLENQNVKHIIHAVGPIYDDYADKTEAAHILKCAYLNSLSLASKNKEIHSIAFPFISSAIYGYPRKEAAHIALESIIEFAQIHTVTGITDIFYVLFSPYDCDLFVKILNSL